MKISKYIVSPESMSSYKRDYIFEDMAKTLVAPY